MDLKKIKIIVNGFQEEVPKDSSIAFLIKHFNESDHSLLVEVNGRFVHPSHYFTTIVNKNDKVEFINMNIGG